MAENPTIPVGEPCWIELFSSDAPRAQAFYGSLFGWTTQSAGEEYGGYFSFLKDGLTVSGGMANDGSQGAPDAWSIYIKTDDIAALTERISANGGMVYMPPMVVMELGSMAIFAAPDGAVISAWQPGEHTGFQRVRENGRRVVV